MVAFTNPAQTAEVPDLSAPVAPHPSRLKIALNDLLCSMRCSENASTCFYQTYRLLHISIISRFYQFGDILMILFQNCTPRLSVHMLAPAGR